MILTALFIEKAIEPTILFLLMTANFWKKSEHVPCPEYHLNIFNKNFNQMITPTKLF